MALREDTWFNRLVNIEFMFLEQEAVLHAVDGDTLFCAATILNGQSAAEVCEASKQVWVIQPVNTRRSSTWSRGLSSGPLASRPCPAVLASRCVRRAGRVTTPLERGSATVRTCGFSSNESDKTIAAWQSSWRSP